VSRAEGQPLDGRVGVVTGGGRGIGRAVALAACRQGASVVVSDLGTSTDGTGAASSAAEDCVEAIGEAGGTAIADQGDVSSFDDMEVTIQKAVAEFGRLDFIVHSAGILRDGIFHKMPVEDFESVITVHLRGAFNIARAAAPLFRSQQSGSYVFLTSTSGLIGAMGQANYSAAKAGMVGLSRSIAIDMARFGVRSNAVAPFARTRLTAQLGDADGVDPERVRRLQAIEADTVAPLVLFLASDRAATVSGQVFAMRMNEIFLMSQSRPLRSVHHSDGWTLDRLSDLMLPSLASYLYDLETSGEHFSWDPI
jgi:NAD(P)-dependent dehydrogenase (short-subunit alcohol dehydrogenase family)